MEIRYVVDDSKLPEEMKKAKEELEEITAPKERSPEYLAMMAKYKKSLNKINREGNQAPWEWSYGLDYLVEFMRFMKDYYTLGENVWGMPEYSKECIDTLTEALDYYNKWQNLDDEYITVIHHPETYKSHENEDGTITVDDLGFHCVYKYGSAKRTYKKLYKMKRKYKRLFFKTIAENIEKWWD